MFLIQCFEIYQVLFRHPVGLYYRLGTNIANSDDGITFTLKLPGWIPMTISFYLLFDSHGGSMEVVINLRFNI